MQTIEPPRYLQVAHWMLAQQKPLRSREVALALDLPPKLISSDFSIMRQRQDIIVFIEQQVRIRGVLQAAIKIIEIHPYILDARRRPFRRQVGQTKNHPTGYSWKKLLSSRWDELKPET
jgi:hypothetical protein